MKDTVCEPSETTASVLLVTTSSRSVSPLTPSPSREIRGLRLFRAISRKLGRRMTDDYHGDDADSRSSSTDSCSSTSTSDRCNTRKKTSMQDFTRSHSPSSVGSDTSSDILEKQQHVRHRHHHSTTAASFRKAFESLSLNIVRSQSCENTKDLGANTHSVKRSAKKNTTPKRILRQPVTYTYVRGMSGLPTQRVPRTHTRYARVANNCYCSNTANF